MSDYRHLEVERAGAVATVWLNRPECLNALNTALLEEIAAAFRSLETEFGVRAIVLAGRGRSFSAGADRTEGGVAKRADAPRSLREGRYATQVGRRAMEAITSSEAVTVARVQGHAVGGGACLVLACDFRIAAAGTRFRIPEVDLGVPLTWGATPRLIYEVGPLIAREWIIMADWVEAEEALAAGFLNRVVAPEELDAEVARWTSKLVDKPELALHMTKTQFRGYARQAFLGDATETDGDIIAAASRTDVARAAFDWKK